MDPQSTPSQYDAETQALIRQLAVIQAALEARLGSEVDTVVDPTSGRALLLGDAWAEQYEHAALTERLLEQVPAVMWATDRDLVCTYVAGPILARVGLRAEDLLGESLPELMQGARYGEPFIEAHRQALAGQPATAEGTWARYPYQAWVEPLRDTEGEISGCLGIGLDISERARLEEELRAARDELEVRVEVRTAELAARVQEASAAYEELEIHQAELHAQQLELLQMNEELITAEGRIEAERRRYQELFDLAPDAYLVTDLWGIVREANRAAAELLGTSRDHLPGKPLELGITARDKRAFRIQITQLQQGRISEIRDWEVQIQSFKGTLCWASIMVSTIRDPSGQVTGLHWLIHDISERKRLEEERERLLAQSLEDREALRQSSAALEAERDLLQAIMENTQAHLAYLDPDFRFVCVNETYARGSGYSKEALIGRKHFDLFPDAENEAIFRQVRDSGQPFATRAKPFVYPERPELGTTYWDWALAPVRDARGEVQGLVFSLVDVTEQERAHQEREARIAHLGLLAQVCRRVLAETTTEKVLQQVVDAARELTGARVGVSGYGYADGTFRVGTTWCSQDAPICPPGRLYHVEHGGAYLELIRGRPSIRLTQEELEAHPAWWGLPEGHAQLRGLLGVGLTGRDGQETGLIMVSDKKEGQFTVEDEALLGQLAALASLALQHIEARQDAERRASELEAVLQAMADGVVVYDTQGTVVRANDAAVDCCEMDLVGKNQEELSRTLQLNDPDGHPMSLEELPVSQVLRGEQVRNQEFHLVTARGRARTVLASATPLLANGELSGVVTVWRDVTAMQEAQRARDHLLEENRSQREFLEQLMDAAPIGIAVIGAEDYRYQYLNLHGQLLLGLSAAQIVGHAVSEVMPPLTAQKAMDDIDQVRRTGEMMRLRGYRASIGPEGKEIYSNMDRVPLRGSDGRVDRVLILVADVTEQALARQRIEELAARDEAILNSMAEGLVLFDLQGNVIDANPAYLHISGFQQVQDLRHHIRTHSLESEMHDLQGRLLPRDEWPGMRVLRGEQFSNLELRAHCVETGQTWARCYGGALVRDREGKPILGLLTVRDVTERKQAETRLAADLAALTRMHALNEKLMEPGELESLLQDIVQAAVDIMGAERGILQLLEGESLRIAATYGHQQAFLEFFVSAEDRASACGEALRRGERVIVPDIETSPLFAGTPSLAVLREAGVRAVQSTPMVDRTGTLLGILTTQWDVPHVPDEHDLWRVDLLARQAADLVAHKQAEEALREHEEQLRQRVEEVETLMRVAPVAIWVSNDPQCDYIVGNPTANSFYESHEQENVSANVSSLRRFFRNGQELKPEELPMQEAAAKNVDIRNVELDVLLPSGKWLNMFGSASPLRDARGYVRGCVGAFVDITERTQAEEQLRQYAGRLRILHETSEAILSARSAEEVAQAALSQVHSLLPCVRAGVSVMDRKTRDMRVLAVYGAESSVLGKVWREPVEPAYIDVIQKLSRGKEVVIPDVQALSTSARWAIPLQAAGVRALLMLPLLSKSGLIGALFLGSGTAGHLAPEQMEVARELAAALAVGIEHAHLYEEVQRYASELEWLVRRRTAALQVSEARFRAIFEEAAMGIALVSRNGTLMSSNSALQKMLGYSSEELKGLPIESLAAADDDGRAATWFQELMAQERSEYTLEQRYACRDGRTIDVRVTASLVRPGKGRARLGIVMVEDITARKRTQAELIQTEKLALTGRLAASMAHEINNPLQSVIGCLGLAQELMADGEDAGQYMQVAMDELERAARIVHQLRELNRRRQFDKEPTDVNDLVERTLLLTQKRCQNRRVEVAWEGTPDLPPILLAPDRIQQILLNLVLNAVEAMPEGGQLRIRTQRTAGPPGVEIMVADTGVGIPPERIVTLFEPFQSTKELGMGMGLYVSREIILEHGGRIDVQSEMGRGTAFTIWLPA